MTLQRSSARRRCVFTGYPRALFLTKLQIYHPNVDLEGNVCLNILREDWKPVLNLNSVMVGLQYLFLEPNADDPLNKGATAASEVPA
jgi:ubiquitin-protein ligase